MTYSARTAAIGLCDRGEPQLVVVFNLRFGVDGRHVTRCRTQARARAAVIN